MQMLDMFKFYTVFFLVARPLSSELLAFLGSTVLNTCNNCHFLRGKKLFENISLCEIKVSPNCSTLNALNGWL